MHSPNSIRKQFTRVWYIMAKSIAFNNKLHKYIDLACNKNITKTCKGMLILLFISMYYKTEVPVPLVQPSHKSLKRSYDCGKF